MAQEQDEPNPWRMAHMGLEFAGAALILGAIGYYVDYKAGSFPIGTLVGLVVGVVGGMYRFLREAVLANRRNMQRYRHSHGQGREASRQRPASSDGEAPDRVTGDANQEDRS